MYSRLTRVSLPLIASFVLLALGMFLLSRPVAYAEPNYECATVSEIPQLECEALVALYDATDGPNWINNTDWLTTTTPCSWYGVTCVGGYAIELNLRYNSLVGIVPPGIGNLTNLRILRLDQNQLTAVPPEIGNLGILADLDLHWNQLTSVPPEIGNLTNLITFSVGLTYVPPEIGNLTNLRNLSIGGQLTSVPPEIGNLTNLTDLSLYGQLTSVPPEIGNLTNLTYLSLYGQLTSVPPEIGNLTNLTYLSIGGQLTSLPPEIGNLTNLTDLSIGGQLTSLPPEIGNLTNLENLYLARNQLTTLPSEIGNLTNLMVLYLWRNQLTTLPPEIGNLTNLTRLSLEDNQLTVMPPAIGSLTSLTSLDLGYNQLTTVPPEIGNLTNVTFLGLYANQLTTLPPEIGDMTNLTDLHLEINKLTSVPPEIGNLGNLRALFLSNSQLTALPSEIGNLTNLEYLNLDNNQLTAVPPEIGNLTNLTGLHLENNQLTAMPSEIGNLINLSSLNLENNQLTAVPPEIGNLTNLKYFRLENNQLTAVPPEIGNLTNLSSLDLGYNQLASVPTQIGSLSNLSNLRLNDNPLSGAMPIELTSLNLYGYFSFYNTSWCIPDTPTFTSWLLTVYHMYGTGLICGQPSSAISGTVSAITPLTDTQAILYRDVGDYEPLWIRVNTVSINDAGQYLFSDLGQDIEYRVRFEDESGNYTPEYYDDVGTVNAATPITVTLGMTRTNINAVLGLPQPPIVDVDTDSGSVNVNPLNGTVAINMTQGNPSDITVTRTVTCTGGATPSLVELLFEMDTETITYTMSSVGNDQYQATIPQADITADATLKVKSTCGGIDDTTTVGTVNLYDPSGNITDANSNQPVVGATVTLYQVPNWRPRTSPSDTGVNSCESNDSKAGGAAWSQPAPTDEGVIVNTDFTTVAPLLSHQQTDVDGHYGWDVPEGCWYVVVRADGYETLTSPVVGIPPEVIDLDLALTPEGGHKIYLPVIVK